MIRILILTTFLGCSVPAPPPASPETAKHSAEGLGLVRTARWPNASTLYGRGSISCSEKGILVKAGRFREEIEVGMSGDLMWFWLRPYNSEFAYTYGRNELPLINDILRPDIIRASLGMDIGPCEWVMEEGLVKATIPQSDHERIVFMDSEKIVAQEFRRDGRLIMRVDVLDHNEKEGVFLPRRIWVTIPEENFAEEMNLGDVEANVRIEEPVPSRPTKDVKRTF